MPEEVGAGAAERGQNPKGRGTGRLRDDGAGECENSQRGKGLYAIQICQCADIHVNCLQRKTYEAEIANLELSEEMFTKLK